MKLHSGLPLFFWVDQRRPEKLFPRLVFLLERAPKSLFHVQLIAAEYADTVPICT